MKRKSLALAVLTVAFLILTLNTIYVKNVEAEYTYTVEWVNHSVEVLYNGYVFINDTIKIGGTPPNSFLMGLPYKYGAHVLGCLAYPLANPTQRYSVVLNVPLESRVGFYGVNVSLSPQPENGVFVVCFVLSQSLLMQSTTNTSLYTLDFPAFPSLTVKTLSCNASVVLPSNAKYVSGTVASFKYSTNEELPAFTYELANVTFQLTTEEIQLFTVEDFRREINIGAMGEITVSDNYYVKNQSPKQISSVEVILLPNASNVAVEDEFGRKGSTPTVVDAKTNRYKVTLTFAGRSMPLESGEAARFIVKYNLPSNITVKNGMGSELGLAMFQNIKYYVKEAQITFTFPEGAKILSVSCENSSDGVAYGTVREIFQEKFHVYKRDVLFLDGLTVKVSYSYNLIWLSFRPTMWAWTLAVLACAIAAVWKRPKAPAAVAVTVPTVAVRLTPEAIRSFVSSYEEKRKIIAEIKSLETAVSKGRIPRRRYKVQRKTLETRLAALTRNLDELRLKLRSAGGRYADLMHQLEVAETEINEVDADIRSIETRHRRGELTLEAYRRLLADYQRRKEKAETAINGILIRLREETR